MRVVVGAGSRVTQISPALTSDDLVGLTPGPRGRRRRHAGHRPQLVAGPRGDPRHLLRARCPGAQSQSNRIAVGLAQRRDASAVASGWRQRDDADHDARPARRSSRARPATPAQRSEYLAVIRRDRGGLVAAPVPLAQQEQRQRRHDGQRDHHGDASATSRPGPAARRTRRASPGTKKRARSRRPGATTSVAIRGRRSPIAARRAESPRRSPRRLSVGAGSARRRGAIASGSQHRVVDRDRRRRPEREAEPGEDMGSRDAELLQHEPTAVPTTSTCQGDQRVPPSRRSTSPTTSAAAAPSERGPSRVAQRVLDEAGRPVDRRVDVDAGEAGREIAPAPPRRRG